MNRLGPNRRDFTFGLGAGMAALAGPMSAAGIAFDDQVAALAKAQASGSKQPLSMLVPDGSRANLAPVVAAFSLQTGVDILMEEVHVDQINTELMLDSMLGTAKYDIALPATFGLPDLADAGAIRPLDDYAARYEIPGFRADVLYEVGDKFDGQTYGFQTDGDAYVMFYHRDMLRDDTLKARYEDEFGHPLLKPTTWTELDRQIQFFHDPEAGRYGGLLFRTPGYLAWEWWVRFHAKGIWPLSPEMTPQIAGDAGVEALEELIAVTEHLVPEVGTLGLFGNWARYARGDVYCNIGWGGTQKYLNTPESPMRGRIEHGPTPGGLVQGELLTTPYFNWGWSFVVSTASTRPELAYLFSLFATTPRMSTLAVSQVEGFFDPYRSEHYHDTRVRDAYSAPFLKVQRAALEGAIPDLYLKGQSDYFQVLGDGLDQALQGHLRPDVALARVAQKWELITSRAGRAAQIKRWKELRAKYPPAARHLLRDII
jgi:multiple sugar transport system substrate-binding protein